MSCTSGASSAIHPCSSGDSNHLTSKGNVRCKFGNNRGPPPKKRGKPHSSNVRAFKETGAPFMWDVLQEVCAKSITEGKLAVDTGATSLFHDEDEPENVEDVTNLPPTDKVPGPEPNIPGPTSNKSDVNKHKWGTDYSGSRSSKSRKHHVHKDIASALCDMSFSNKGEGSFYISLRHVFGIPHLRGPLQPREVYGVASAA